MVLLPTSSSSVFPWSAPRQNCNSSHSCTLSWAANVSSQLTWVHLYSVCSVLTPQPREKDAFLATCPPSWSSHRFSRIGYRLRLWISCCRPLQAGTKRFSFSFRRSSCGAGLSRRSWPRGLLICGSRTTSAALLRWPAGWVILTGSRSRCRCPRQISSLS